MKLSLKRILFCCALFQIGTAVAYEIPTHEDISVAAVTASVLERDARALEVLGLKPLREKQRFSINGLVSKTIIEHIRDGASSEDNGEYSIHHFFDPLNDRGLLGFGNKSPDWALEDKGDLDDQVSSFKDARETFYRALTNASEEQREKNFALTFEKLGHVIHHIEDMAQPQHVRNDQHLDFPYVRLPGIENPSLYEQWTNDHRAENFFTQLLVPNIYPPVRFDTARTFWHTEDRNPSAGRGIAEFTNANFVSAGTNFDKQPGETGYFPSPVPLLGPPAAVSIQTLLREDGTCGESGSGQSPACQLQGDVIFYATNVQDNYKEGTTVVNDRASTLSIFDQDLKQYNITDPVTGQPKSAFTLNRFNFRSVYPHLIPRAVAYSAGLIDYFFRGRLEAEDAGYTDTGISLRVRNAIDAKALPAWTNETFARNGSLTLAYEYKLPDPANTGVMRTFVGSSAAQSMNEESDLGPGETSRHLYSFTLNKIPKEASEVKYRLVFRGLVGKEGDAIAVGPVAPLSGFVVTPSYTPADGISGARHIYRAWGEWRLSDRTGFKAGNIDWKGWYSEGKPAKVLSWSGPRSRYFPESASPFSPEVYQNGELFAQAPLPVLGAALTRDAQGQEWLVVICRNEDYSGLVDVVYRRPNKKSNSAALYHPSANPDGWQQIGRFSHGWYKFHDINTPWFFNGEGTEAQTMRAGDNGPVFWLYRLRIDLGADRSSATFSNEGNSSGTQTRTKSVTCDNGQESRTSDAWSAQYNVAVDFLDDKPLFAVVADSGEGDTYGWYLGTSDGLSRGFNQNLNSVKVLRIPGAPDLTLSSTVTQRTEDDRPVVYNASVAYGYSHYLDLRSGLHSVYRDMQDQYASGELVSCSSHACFPIETVRRTEQSASFGAQTITLNQNLEVTTSGSRRAFSYSPDNSDCGTNSSDTGLPNQSFPSRMRSTGSFWAVDGNGNLIASQAKYGPNPSTPTGEMFNYLTDGDLVQLIPGAPAEPSYSSIGAIR